MGKLFQGLKERSVLMALLLAVACFLAYYFPAVLGTDTAYTHFFYIPVILASFWWQRRGLLVAAFLAAVVILNHIFLRAGMPTADDYFRITILMIVAFVTAMLNERIAETWQQIAHLNLTLRAIRNVNQLITKERDREILLKGVCDNLTKTRSYHSAWIALLDESGKSMTHAETGLGRDFLPMVDRLKLGELPRCTRQVFEQSGVLVVRDPALTCTDCSLSGKYAEDTALSARLEYGGNIYGLLSASIAIAFVTDEETTLFQEIANDAAFALHNIELEESRQQAEAEIKDSEERFRGILEDAPFGYYRVGKDGLWQYVNPVWERMHGLSLEDVVGKPFEITQPEDTVKQAREFVRRVLDGETLTGEFSRLTKSGEIGYHNFNIQPVYQGQKIIAIEG